jgi:DNA excision repair protein ERCC-5
VFSREAMGVNGLWKLLDPSGKPVPLETLENKVLAVGILYYN